MTVLVTGCAGFIGSRVTELLSQQGTNVVGIDNVNDAYDPRLKEWRLDRLKKIPNFRFEHVDITDRVALKKVFQDSDSISGNLEAVINLAARAGVRQSVQDPWIYIDTNTTGLLNLLEICRESGVPKLIQASTSSLYGALDQQPFREDANTDSPLSPYAASKKAAEALCYAYHYLYGIDITVLRYFTVYGPAGRPDMSLFRFVQWISEKRQVTVYGNGKQSRDFTYVDDIALGTIAGLKPLGYEVINLGSDHPEVLHNVISLIESALGARAQIVYEPSHDADVFATWADISKAKKLLNWQPQTSLESGVDNLVSWYRQNRDWAKNIRT